MKRNDEVTLAVRGVALDGSDADPVVILEDRERRFTLPVSVGPFEAGAIILELEGIRAPRPLTHDLLADLFRAHGFAVKRAVLSRQDDGVLSARLEYRKGLLRWSRDLRPSDAIALALRLGAPLLASRAMLSERLEPGAPRVAADPTRTDGVHWLEARPAAHETGETRRRSGLHLSS